MLPFTIIEISMTLIESFTFFISSAMPSFNSENLIYLKTMIFFNLKIYVAVPMKSFLCIHTRNESQAKYLCKLRIGFQSNKACVCHWDVCSSCDSDILQRLGNSFCSFRRAFVLHKTNARFVHWLQKNERNISFDCFPMPPPHFNNGKPQYLSSC